MLLCLVKHSYSSTQSFLVMEHWELWTAPAPLMWTSAGSWVGSPTPRAGYKLIGTTIPVLNMAIYPCKNIKIFHCQKEPQKSAQGPSWETYPSDPLLSSSVYRLELPFSLIYSSIRLFIYGFIFLDFWIHKSWAKFNRKYREFPYTPSPATSSLSHH